MSTKSALATITGKSSYWFLHNFLKGGSSFPGKVAERIDPDILKTLANGYDVVIVTGTNGKTLTTALIVKVLQQKYDGILTNPTGSNMTQGIVTAFLAHKKNKNGKKLAILEVDEANVAPICRYIKPKAFVLTNIFRDQMDRYGEIYTTYAKILDGIKLAPEATVIANGDAAIFASKPLPNPTIYYGFSTEDDHLDFKANVNTDGVLCPVCNHILHYHELSYANLGNYFCPNCGFHRPELAQKVTQILEKTPKHSKFMINEQTFTINIGGTYNIYNALAAYTVGRFFDIDPVKIAQAFAYDEKVFGRQEVISMADKELTLILVKNPVGLNEVLNLLNNETDDFSLAVLLNANYADGIDTSWIWDGDFEHLPFDKIKGYVAGGERSDDIAFRLQVANVPEDKLNHIQGMAPVLDAIKDLPTKKVYVLATYTAMLQLRKALASANLIKEGF
ncbi:Mur ligase family protein [Lactobacillus sp. CC-MHH1034]|uniref:Mur ligase family protein n=1 Tax=Agrilactobacillus fermenti TaxID=2586909 RepID=UPI001E47B7EF|nr:Mur ligase family protein [Agrilactobacillus fermenti]MCD2256424.1 Mur ligase family protein [Agrilactobacillus fermenti]